MGKNGEKSYSHYGSFWDVRLDFDGLDEEVIEIRVDSEFIDISDSKCLPENAKLNSVKEIDENIEAFVKDGQLKDVVKSKKGSLKSEVAYNTEIRKGNEWEWH